MHTLVLGASTNPNRASNRAINMLVERNFPITAIGIRDGEVAGIPIIQTKPDIKDLHTITLYLNPLRQLSYYDYILDLKPERIIFNPGTENATLLNMAKNKGIDTVVACTLVMLTLDDY